MPMPETVDRQRAAQVTDQTRDDPDQRSIGSWIRQRVTGVYHASVAFDGYDHTTRCGAALKAGVPGQVDDAAIDVDSIDAGSWFCQDCIEPPERDGDADG